MALPTGIVTRAVQFQIPFDEITGASLSQRVTFTPNRSLIWSATGQPAIALPFAAVSSGGEITSFNVPVTDQLGWEDGDGNAIIPNAENQTHGYDVMVEYMRGTRVISTAAIKTVVVPTGDMPLDLNEMVGVDSATGVTIYIPDRWSEQLAAALAAAAAAQQSAEDAGEVAAIATPDGVIASRVADRTSLTGKALESRYDRADRFLPGYQVATNCWGIQHGGAAQPPTQTQAGTSRSKHIVAVDCCDLRLVFSNAAMVGQSAEGDGVGTSLPISASIEIGGVIKRVTFGGLKLGTADPGGLLVSDPIGVDVTAGTILYVRTYTSQTSWYGVSGCYQTDGSSGGFTVTTDLTAPGSAAVANASHWLLSPAAILGTPYNRDTESIVLIGDSVISGFGDLGAGGGGYYSQWSAGGVAGGGYVVRGLGATHGWINLGNAGDTVHDFVAKHERRLAIASGASLAISDYGINDVQAARSFATISADLLALWTMLDARGIRVLQATLTPKTTSTDAWATTANQTIPTPAQETVRVAVNNWIRTLPAPLSGVIEAADLAETARNSGIWKAGYTADGLHPNAAGAAALAPSVVI